MKSPGWYLAAWRAGVSALNARGRTKYELSAHCGTTLRGERGGFFFLLLIFLARALLT